MTPLDSTSFLVLNAAHLNKMATAGSIASATGEDLETVNDVLNRAEQSALGALMGEQFLLLPEGSNAVLDYYNEVYGELRARQEIVAWYDRFETVNVQFIKQVSDWQNSDGDGAAKEKLLKTAGRLVRMIATLQPAIPRYEGYVRRLERSVALVDQDKTEFVCDPTIDSVHNIWFEFHEDILSVLGRPRDT